MADETVSHHEMDVIMRHRRGIDNFFLEVSAASPVHSMSAFVHVHSTRGYSNLLIIWGDGSHEYKAHGDQLLHEYPEALVDNPVDISVYLDTGPFVSTKFTPTQPVPLSPPYPVPPSQPNPIPEVLAEGG